MNNANGTILVTGNTYPVKEQLKALGGRWDAASKGWRVPATKATAARALVAVPVKVATPAPSAYVARQLAQGACCCAHCEGDDDGDGQCVRFWGVDY